MTKTQYKEFRRFQRISRRMSEELWLDITIYGTSFQYIGDCGIFNIPPFEISIDEDGKLTWSLLP